MKSLHASAVAWPDGGVLLCGPSGSGKSSLAAHLIDAHQAELVADDRVVLTPHQGCLLAQAADPLQGLLELRGLGVCTYPFSDSAKLALAVVLTARADVPRMASAACFTAFDIAVPQLTLHAFDLATPIIIKSALRDIAQNGFQADGLYHAPPPKNGKSA